MLPGAAKSSLLKILQNIFFVFRILQAARVAIET